ncbi:MAG: UDP-glucose 4-epimerase GalE [Clostridia bacterium]|jgi:UDP-glucose 4-epimerase|nr:UDP-glucose 4-epimerase GalE [Clostridia bacterium]
MTILVTGGAGFIGSHTCVELLDAGYDTIILDNLCNSKSESIKRIEEITGKSAKFYNGDIRDRAFLDKVFSENRIDGVIHFAGLKAVGESVQKPLEYYDNNIGGTVTLLEAMRDAGCKRIVFSSSATVYGAENESPLREDMPEGKTTNPYGTTKLYIERILRDTYAADNSWSICLLRYFNPIGAHKSGRIGEDPNGIPNNLVPYIAKVAVGKLDHITVFGDDYPTPDGTGVRDYIHVVDLAIGHIRAVEKIADETGCFTYNLGTGKGYSVLDVIHAFEKACGHPLKYEIAARRAGDLATCYSDPSKAGRELGWKAERDIDEMCEDSWRWQSSNPDGYADV